MTVELDPEFLARFGEVIPAGNWVEAMADKDGVRARLESLRQVAWPDLEIAMIAPGGFTGRFHGVDGFFEAWEDWLRPFDSYSVEIEELRGHGDRIVALARHSATPKGTEATVEGTAAAVMTFREGRLARIEFNLDREAALRGAGLESSRVPSSNIELARRAFEAIQVGGLPAALDFLDPEVEFEPPGEALEQRGSFRGHTAVRERWDVLFDPFNDVRIEPEEFLEADEETVVAVFRVQARGKSSGVPVEMRLAHVLTIRDGKAVRMKAFLDPAEAKRAVGLEP